MKSKKIKTNAHQQSVRICEICGRYSWGKYKDNQLRYNKEQYEHRKHTIWGTTAVPRTNGGRNGHRIPTPLQAVRRIDGIHGVRERRGTRAIGERHTAQAHHQRRGATRGNTDIRPRRGVDGGGCEDCGAGEARRD